MWAPQLADATVDWLAACRPWICSSSLTRSASEVLMILHPDAHLADGEELKLTDIYITCTIAWAV